jgi:restriction system protein
VPIPDYQTIMLPLLQFAADGEEHSLAETVDALAKGFKLSSAELTELLPSGQQEVFKNRVGWSRMYLKKAGLLETPRRGLIVITEAGRATLAENPGRIDVHFLERFPAFIEFRTLRKSKGNGEVFPIDGDDRETPEEVLEHAYQSIRQALAQELLNRITGATPAFFERLVVDLLVRMGYGGSRKDAGERIGQSGDGGIDGIIKEDRLGLDTIYIQAKRWQGPVGRPEIQKFVGALQGKRAHKGVFITASSFTADAREYAGQIGTTVVLLDGPQLANYMIDFDLGLATFATYSVKRIDSDFFEEE